MPTVPSSRLAPSPTGALHLGNARTFLINWLIGRQSGWNLPLRIDDLDGPRVKAGADQQALADLTWLGLDWDGQPIYQSHRLSLYQAAVNNLLNRGLAYPCVCSRKEVESAASAPHAEDQSVRYPGTCDGRFISIHDAVAKTGRQPALRFRVPPGPVSFNDNFFGPQTFDLSTTSGDFVIAKADATPAYQLAVVVDDAEMGVTHILRGDDLLDSTPRQLLLYRALGLDSSIPHYIHVPLVVGLDGRRLAKRHGDTRLSSYRESGVPPERIVAMLARWCGINPGHDEITARELIGKFDLANLPHHQITFDPAASHLS